MKGIQIAKTGGLEVLQYLDVTKPLLERSGMLLVKNDFIGVNYIDTYHRSGLYALPTYPATLGREGAGIVVESTSAKFKTGERVAYFSPGAYAEFVAVTEDKACHLPNGIDTRTAAASLLQGLTALAFSTQSFAVKPGDFALIHAAAGGTGSNLVQMVKAFGGYVIGTTTR